MATADAVFKALADPTRREILHLLRSGPRSSGEIAARFPTAWATVSRHLAVLRNAELVTTERNGSTILYELDTTVFQETVEHLLNWIQPRASRATRRRGRLRTAVVTMGVLCAAASDLAAQLPTGAATPVERDPPAAVAESPFTFARDGLTLHGTVAMPRAVPDRMPVVVIVAGSGPTDRNANGPLVSTNAYAFLAWGLAEEGIASLRYDKRGIGMSAGAGGDPTTLTIDDYVADVTAAAAAVASDERFSNVILLGHSEGAGHVLQAANRGAPQGGVVMVAGMGRRLADVVHEQIARHADSTTAAVADSAFARFLRGEDPGEVPPIAQPLIVPAYRNFLRSMAAYDPQSEARDFAGPLLILQGTTDVQVTLEDAELLHAAQPRATLVRLENVNHVLKLIESVDLPSQTKTYGDPSLPLAPSVVPAIARWIEGLDR